MFQYNWLCCYSFLHTTYLRGTISSQRISEKYPANPIGRTDIPSLPIVYQQRLNGKQFLLLDNGMVLLRVFWYLRPMMRCFCYQYQKNDLAITHSKYFQRHFLRSKLEVITELYFTFMVFSPIKTKLRMIGFFKKSLIDLLLLLICQHDFWILKSPLLTHFLKYFKILA